MITEVYKENSPIKNSNKNITDKIKTYSNFLLFNYKLSYIIILLTIIYNNYLNTYLAFRF